MKAYVQKKEAYKDQQHKSEIQAISHQIKEQVEATKFSIPGDLRLKTHNKRNKNTKNLYVSSLVSETDKVNYNRNFRLINKLYARKFTEFKQLKT